ncbi:hypothetical protein Syun_023467 [Stephania yunnanensis]|uniref:Uncharacterized protein n=1 Tax=Stephania yunnanensis TaxID=152371 RepID=A0AAP0F9V8_9MAGN
MLSVVHPVNEEPRNKSLMEVKQSARLNSWRKNTRNGVFTCSDLMPDSLPRNTRCAVGRIADKGLIPHFVFHFDQHLNQLLDHHFLHSLILYNSLFPLLSLLVLFLSTLIFLNLEKTYEVWNVSWSGRKPVVVRGVAVGGTAVGETIGGSRGSGKHQLAQREALTSWHIWWKAKAAVGAKMGGGDGLEMREMND